MEAKAVNSLDEKVILKNVAENRLKVWKIITIILLFIILCFGTLFYYQKTHFNANIVINDVNVGRLTSDQALNVLQTSPLNNDIYIGDSLIYEGKKTEMNYTEEDLPYIKSFLESQWTFFPSSETKSFYLEPTIQDGYRAEGLRKELEEQLVSLNQTLQAPVDARASIDDGKIIVSQSFDGEQYDINSLLEDYDKQEYRNDIHLQPFFLEPIKEDSEEVNLQIEMLDSFLNRTIEYEIQDKVHLINASEVIQKASLSDNMDVLIESDTILDTITDLIDRQSTLGKDYIFTTHSGKEITVKGQGYGWALDIEKEAELIYGALEGEDPFVSASHIYGNGWQGEGYGYNVTSNYGIGGTYAEVSIADQRMWIYKDGKLVVTTNVVTGNRKTQRDTLPGVWYVLYKRTNYTLTGTSADDSDYAIEVDYWAPFTNSGQGFHDAGWRTNWSKNAYLTEGSNGCVNVPPNVMKAIYENLATYDPVVIY
ncbi:L,D-transpeptidase family protein [Evansella tamaricis]|uniref:L,D-transpeptidase/peptidoglycan binding protein n=1 Tax=Evansella tamaricis TaxID=2069301 RepID=A0ABS6J9X9_9BACI|nr:L,D-transpeptidase family protein [Evansella tamaricis]MBU9710494.1 L,D-transpeptidase/peptidoglycan binding protein [Evansella tamaricis]